MLHVHRAVPHDALELMCLQNSFLMCSCCFDDLFMCFLIGHHAEKNIRWILCGFLPEPSKLAKLHHVAGLEPWKNCETHWLWYMLHHVGAKVIQTFAEDLTCQHPKCFSLCHDPCSHEYRQDAFYELHIKMIWYSLMCIWFLYVYIYIYIYSMCVCVGCLRIICIYIYIYIIIYLYVCCILLRFQNYFVVRLCSNTRFGNKAFRFLKEQTLGLGRVVAVKIIGTRYARALE